MPIMYFVVEFLDNSVGIVSNSWTNGDNSMTFWPPYADPNKFKVALLTHAVPGPAWTTHTITVLGTADDYEKARKKAKMAETHLAVASEPEELERCQRSRQPTKRYITLPEPGPSRPLPPVPPAAMNLTLMSPPPPPSPVRQPSLSSSSSHSGQAHHMDTQLLSPPQPLPIHPPLRQPSSSSRNPSEQVDDQLSPPLPIYPPARQPSLSSGLERYLVSTLEEIKDRLSALERTVTMLARSGSNKHAKLPDNLELPLQNFQDLNGLEEKLEDSPYQKELTAYLGTIGGATVQATTRRVLATVFGHSLAMTINWNGCNDKRAFRDLKLKRVVVDAVRRGSMDSPPAAQIEDEVKVWFRNARDRAGGRRQRYIRVAAQDV
ncbi:histone-lysine N-methyltransferase 2B-like [Neoarius graeffei]|uniref:histone-lysine N-methyltransferase 2B-like n=3 Tax=Neoarius graeffei TaxID=443677 RepID=UPI00298D4CE1|nr:histone-lysine N-methyltransferase 2B-like [Neoarius graeffei]